MAEHLDEGVLNRLVCFGPVAKILKRDAQRAALVRDDQALETLTSARISTASWESSDSGADTTRRPAGVVPWVASVFAAGSPGATVAVMRTSGLIRSLRRYG
jgi:hypothetical protein